MCRTSFDQTNMSQLIHLFHVLVFTCGRHLSAKYSGKHVCVTDSVSNKKHVILVVKILTFANEALTGLPIYVSDLLALGWFELIHIKHILLKVIAKALDFQYALDLQWHALYSSSNCNLMSCFQFISSTFMNALGSNLS